METAVLDSLPSLTTNDLLCRATQVVDSCVGLYVFGMTCMSATRNRHCKVRRIEMCESGLVGMNKLATARGRDL